MKSLFVCVLYVYVHMGVDTCMYLLIWVCRCALCMQTRVGRGQRFVSVDFFNNSILNFKIYCLKISYMTIMCFLNQIYLPFPSFQLLSYRSTTFPSQLPVFFFKSTKLIQWCQYKYCVAPSTGTWAAIQGQHPRRTDSPPVLTNG